MYFPISIIRSPLLLLCVIVIVSISGSVSRVLLSIFIWKTFLLLTIVNTRTIESLGKRVVLFCLFRRLLGTTLGLHIHYNLPGTFYSWNSVSWLIMYGILSFTQGDAPPYSLLIFTSIRCIIFISKQNSFFTGFSEEKREERHRYHMKCTTTRINRK